MTLEFDCDIDSVLKDNITKYILKYREKCDSLTNDIVVCEYEHTLFSEKGHMIYKICNFVNFPLVWIRANHYMYRLISLMPIGNVSLKEYDFNIGNPCLYYTYEELDQIKAKSTAKKKKTVNRKKSKKIKHTPNNFQIMKSPIKWLYEILKNNDYDLYFKVSVPTETQYQNYTKWCEAKGLEATSKIGWMRELSKFGKSTNKNIVRSKVAKVNKKSTKVFIIASCCDCEATYTSIYGDHIFV